MRTGQTTIPSLPAKAAEAMQERREQAGLPNDAPLGELRRAERRARRFVGLQRSLRVLWEDEEVRQYTDCQEDQCLAVTVGTLELRITGSSYVPQVRLLGTCPQCGARTPSVMFYNLEGLGELLEEFTPDYSHTHSYMYGVPPVAHSAAHAVEETESRAAVSEGAAAQRLTEALDELIRERLASVAGAVTERPQADESANDELPCVDQPRARGSRKS